LTTKEVKDDRESDQDRVVQLERECEEKDLIIQRLRVEIEASQERTSEAERQLRWTTTELNGRIEGRERRIEELRKALELQRKEKEVAKLQEECKRIYGQTEAYAAHRLEDVTRRARTPREQPATVIATPKPPQASRAAPPSPTSARAKVFRHRLQKALAGGASNVAAASPVDKATFDINDMSTTGSGAPPYPLSHRASFPANYRSGVATLPPILGRSNSIVGTSSPSRTPPAGSAKGRRSAPPQEDSIEVTVLAQENESNASAAVRAASST